MSNSNYFNGAGSLNYGQPQPGMFSFGANNPAPTHQPIPAANPGVLDIKPYGSETVNNFQQMDYNSPAGNRALENNGLSTGGGTGTDWTHGERAFGGTDAQGNSIGGYAMPALQLGSGLLQGYIGLKQLGLARDRFDESKEQFNLNYDAQRSTTNAQIEDRHRSRRAAGGTTQSMDSHMNQNQIQER